MVLVLCFCSIVVMEVSEVCRCIEVVDVVSLVLLFCIVL